MTDISIIMPVRKNCPWIGYFLDSFSKNTVDTDGIEVILGLAEDDSTTKIEHKNIRTIRLDQRRRKFGVGDYTNKLASETTGDLIWWLSDECVINTHGYDNVLRIFSKHSVGKIYTFCAYMNGFSGWLYPMITRKWLDTTGRWGNHVSIDSWISEIRSQLPPERSIEIQAVDIEDRHLTGKITDKEAYNLQPEVPFDHIPWESDLTRKDIQVDLDKIRKAIGEGA